MDERFARIGRRLVVATHRRSGTHLTLDLLRRQLPECRARKRLGEGLDALYLNLDRLDLARRPLSEDAALELLRRAPRPLVKTHRLPEHRRAAEAGCGFRARLLADADVYAVVRDGRDVLCSLHAYVRSYDRRAPASLSEFLRQERDGVSRVAAWAREVRETLAEPGIRVLRYEEIVSEPRAVLERLARELGVQPLYAEPLLPRPLHSRWGSRLGRLARNPEATTVPGAGGVADWHAAFSRADRAFFHCEAGALLLELGYESSDAWIDEIAA
jgi:hypothetical protein